jgi:hypothetical protein
MGQQDHGDKEKTGGQHNNPQPSNPNQQQNERGGGSQGPNPGHGGSHGGNQGGQKTNPGGQNR